MKWLAIIPAVICQLRLLRALLLKQTLNQSDHCSAVVDNPSPPNTHITANGCLIAHSDNMCSSQYTFETMPNHQLKCDCLDLSQV